MAVKLRLMRMGKKKQPTYRVVAADSRSPRDGRFIEIVGTYDPRPDPSTITIDNERAVHWLRHGAQPTERVEKLLKISGAWTDFTGEEPPPAVTVAGSAKAADQAAPAEAVIEDAPVDLGDEVESGADDTAEEVADEVVDGDSTAEGSDDTAEGSDDTAEGSEGEEE